METVCTSPLDETVVKNTLRDLGPPDHLQYRLDGLLSLVGGRNATFLVQHGDGRPTHIPHVVPAADEAAPVGEDDDVFGGIRVRRNSPAALS